MNAALADVLEAVARRLAGKGAWTLHANARDERGIDINPAAPAATCWCLNGALIKELGPMPEAVVFESAKPYGLHANAIRELERQIVNDEKRSTLMTAWNDRQLSVWPVLGLLRRTAARLRTEAKVS